MIEKLLLIALVCTYTISYSGFCDSVDEFLQRWLKNPFVHVPKPFSCPLCMTFWCSLIYIALTGNFTITGIALACIASWATKLIEPLLHLLVDFWTRMVDAVYNYFDL